MVMKVGFSLAAKRELGSRRGKARRLGMRRPRAGRRSFTGEGCSGEETGVGGGGGGVSGSGAGCQARSGKDG
jgi:hypothetical protein